MPSPHVSTNFPDLLDRRFTKIFVDQYDQLPTMLPLLYSMQSARKGADEKYSEVGDLTDFDQFTATLSFDSANQGFDVTATHLEFAKGISVRRKLRDDDLFGVIDDLPRGLATAAKRTRESDGARIYTLAFSIDTKFYNHSEGVPLCSNSHTTTSGASTSSGFDNLLTSALSAAALATARIQMRDFRDDRANRINIMPNEIWIPPDLYETAFEIVSSMGKVETANNNANVHMGQYTIYEWNYMTDTNDWFLTDSNMRKENLKWFDRIGLEFGRAEEFDTFNMKWRAYMRYSNLWRGWRWILGNQVS